MRLPRAGTLLRSTRPPSLASDQGQGPSKPAFRRLAASPLGVVVQQAASRQIDHAVAAEEGRPDGDVLPPDAVDRLLPLVGQRLLDGQHGRARLQGQGLLEEEGRPVGADPAAEADPVRGVLDDDGVPRHGVDLGVDAEVGPPVVGRVASARKDRLPPSLVHVHPDGRRIGGGGHELGRVADAPRRAPHEVDVGGLVDELIDVGALVDQHDDAEQLVLQNGGLQPAVAPGVRDAAAVVPLCLVVHCATPRCCGKIGSRSGDGPSPSNRAQGGAKRQPS